MIKYLIPFLISFLLTVALTILLILIAKKIKWKKRSSDRHIHKDGAHRIGGIAMALAFNVAIMLNRDLVITPELYGLMIGSLAIMVFGFWDDIREIYWKIQISCQIGVAILIFILGVRIYYITNPITGGIISLDYGLKIVIATLLIIFWIVLVMNAVNWLDGVDGLSGGVTAISSMTIFFLSLHPEVNQPPVAIISSALFGAALGFVIFNFYPSRILAGTSGSMFMGLALAVLAVFSGTKIATALLVLSIPIIDLVWVIGERIKSGESIFKPDKKHLHYRLLDLGWSQKKIALFYYVVTGIIAFIALNTRVIGKGITISLVVILMVVFYLAINKKTAGIKN
jgi:UDP-GlcNAc:undecaprenyl-phosphate/decaprenyl-phosphate GlcNAc-1-phosphate transferase